MKKDKKPYNPAAYPLFGIRLSPHPLQFIVMSHLRVQFVLHLFKEVGAAVAFPAFDVRIEAVAVFGLHTEKGIEDRSKLFQRSLAAIDAAGGVEGINQFYQLDGIAGPLQGWDCGFGFGCGC